MKDEDALRPPKWWQMVFLGPPVFLAWFLYRAWALQTVWNWYVPPVFDVASLTFPHALGLTLATMIIAGGSGWSVGQAANVLLKKENPELYKAARIHGMVRIFLGSLMLVGFAWVLQTIWPPM